ncbi:MAG: M23 family metallopeptidase, partial [Nocardioidaceae bacterium]
PDSDHPSGRAVDVMIDDYQSTQGNQLGWRVARWARTHAKALGITYVIFDQRIWSSQRSEDGWRNYTHPSGKGDATAAHENHVHISVSGNAAGRASRSGGPAVLPVKPGDYELTSPYGYRSNVAGGGTHELHTGQDFAADPGTPIHAATAGTVTTAEACACGYGNYVVIKTGQLEFYYAHQNSLDVHAGQHVKAGQIIGRVGSTGRATGPHLHFEIRRNGHSEDPIPWLEQQGLKP